jgi:hypothetical protein
MTYHVDISNTFWVMLHSGEELSIKITKGKLTQGRVIILVHCTPLQWGLSTHEVSSWYLNYFLRYDPDKNLGGRKDGRTEGRTETISISPAAFSAGIIKSYDYCQKYSVSHKIHLFLIEWKHVYPSITNLMKTFCQQYYF